MTANTLEQRARELLAAEYHKRGWTGVAIAIDRGVLTALSEAERAGLIAIEAALRLSAGADWQPIETAPHDRPCIVTNGVAVGEANWFKDDDGWWWAQTDPTDAHDGRVYEPTHWQPLPAAPRHDPDDALRGDKT